MKITVIDWCELGLGVGFGMLAGAFWPQGLWQVALAMHVISIVHITRGIDVK